MTDLDVRGHHTVTGLSKPALPGLRTTLKFLLFKKESKDSLRVFPKVCQYAG